MVTVNNNTMQVVFCKHSDLRMIKGDITYDLCTSINKMFPGQALCAQKLKSVWAICIRDSESRKSLLRRGIMIGNTRVEVYPDDSSLNNTSSSKSQRVVVKDLPFWEPDSLISDYMKTVKQITQCSDVYLSKARNNLTKKPSAFLNGDRYVFVNEDMHPPLPHSVTIGAYECRVRHISQTRYCIRCQSCSHKTDDKDACPAFIEPADDVILFSSGIFSNFHRCPVTMDGITFPTSEHAYQWRACIEALREDLAEKVIKSSTPREAKVIANEVKHDKHSDWHNMKCTVMKDVLRAKLESSETFKEALIKSGDKKLVEARVDDFWGSGLTYNLTLNTRQDKYPGSNKLGVILCELRDELMSKPDDAHAHLLNKQVDANSDVMDLSSAPPRPTRSATKTGSQIRVSSLSPSRLRVISAKGTPLIKDMMKQQMKRRKRHISDLEPESQDIETGNDDDASEAVSDVSFTSAVNQTMDVANMADFESEVTTNK